MRRLLLILFVLIPAALVAAQGAPEQINIALERLSGEVNQNLTLDQLEDWRWGQELYPDTSLGCPQPDTAYSQVSTQGYSFLLTYQGVTYDYRVSADGDIAFLCSQTGGDAEPTATPVDPEAIDPGVICPEPEPGIMYLPSRLTADIQARVAPGAAAALRDQPGDEAAATAEMPPGAIFALEGGPVCLDGQLWWQVNYDGAVGWASEGVDEVYALEAIPGLPLPSGLPVIDASNALEVTELSRTENNIIPQLATSPTGPVAAVVAGPGTAGVWLYNLTALDTPATLLTSGDSALTSIDYDATGGRVALGDGRGGVRVWSTDPASTLVERWFDQGYNSLTTAVAFSPDRVVVASAGDVAVTNATDNRDNAILLWDIEAVQQIRAISGHTGPVNALAFSAAGNILASASDDGTVRLWNPADGSSLAVLEGHTGPVTAIAFNPDDTRLASAGNDGSVIEWDLATMAQAQGLQESGVFVSALAYSPDGALLASGGGDDASTDYTIRLWDVATGQALNQLAGHVDTVGGLAFSADGTVLVSASEDKSVRFWGAGAAG